MRQPPRPGAPAPLARPLERAPRAARARARAWPRASCAASARRGRRVALAEQGGFDAVKLRDVAEASGVALGTLYKYFRSKEEILLFAVNEDMERSRP